MMKHEKHTGTRRITAICVGWRSYAALYARLALLETRRASPAMALSRCELDELAALQSLAAITAMPRYHVRLAMTRLNKDSSLAAILFARLQLWTTRRLFRLSLALESLAKILRDTAVRIMQAIQQKMQG